MSDTPRTTHLFTSNSKYGHKWQDYYDLCVRLEQELAQAKAELSTLRAECERLKEDAERYRYLRTHSYVERMGVKDGIGIIHVGVGFQQTRPEFLDADIDEALRLDAARKDQP